MDYTEYEKLDIESVPKFSFDTQSFWCRVIKVNDGDTITGIINFVSSYYKISIRLSGIDTCEKTSKHAEIKSKALEAKNRLIELIGFDKSKCCMVFIKCYGFDKYGRVLADLYKDSTSNVKIQNILLDEHLAYKYEGAKKKTNEDILCVLNENQIN